MTQKNLLTLCTATFLIACLNMSCQKEESLDMTEAEAVEIIETSLQKNSGGMVESTEAYTEKLVNDTVQANCSTFYQDSFDFAYESGFVEANYAVCWSFEFSCSPLNVPQSAQFDVVSSGSYQTNRLNSNDNIIANLTATGLNPGSAGVIYNGNFDRSGQQQINMNLNNRNLSSTVNINIQDLYVSKSNYQIQSGTAQVELTGTDQNNNFSYSGSLVFTGSGNATLYLNSNSYSIDLYQ